LSEEEEEDASLALTDAADEANKTMAMAIAMAATLRDETEVTAVDDGKVERLFAFAAAGR